MSTAVSGARSAQLERGAQALVAERRRQPDVDDRDVGALAQHGVDERVAVVDGGDDLEAVVAQQPRQPVAQQREVLGDHDPHGSTARSVVGPPGGLDDRASRRAPRRGAQPVSPVPAASAPPAAVVGDLDDERVALPRDDDRRRASRRACLPAFASASATTKYAAVSTGGGRPLADVDVEVDRERRCGRRAPRSPPRARGR